MTLDEIGRLVRDYADAREALEEVVAATRDLQRRAVRMHIRSIRARVANASATREVLHDAIDGSRGLFVRPRTQSLHGVKFGLRKQPGRIEGDEPRAIARIESRMADRASQLVRVKKSLDRPALLKLTARELASIGISVVQDDDKVFINTCSSDLDKLVDAMLADDAQEMA